MKKTIIGLVAIIAAISGSAFISNNRPTTLVDFRYFPLDVNGNIVPQTVLPTLNQPASCPGDDAIPCARKYTSYTIVDGKYVGLDPVASSTTFKED